MDPSFAEPELKIAHACSFTMHIALIFIKISYKQTTEE